MARKPTKAAPEYICITKLQELLYTASLPELLTQFFATGHRNLCAPDLLHKPILTTYLCLNKPTCIFVLLGYTDSVTSKVLILFLLQWSLSPNLPLNYCLTAFYLL